MDTIYRWEKAKRPSWQKLNLWLIDEDLRPIWADGGGTRGAHDFMPCAEGVAWPQVQDRIQ